MGMIASFTVIKEKDVPFLGVWSKMRRGFFRRRYVFCELLKEHTLREAVFESADGYYVALVFGWLDINDERFERDVEPFIRTVRRQRHMGGSYWLITSSNLAATSFLKQPMSESQWREFLRMIGEREEELRLELFEEARHFAVQQISELRPGEALFVSVD